MAVRQVAHQLGEQLDPNQQHLQRVIRQFPRLAEDAVVNALILLDVAAQRGGRSVVAVDLVDASALLWRLDLSGVDVGDRWNELSAAWDAQADGRLYAFNDWHAAMAHLGAGRPDAVKRLLAAAREAEGSEAAHWMRETGLPLIEGFTAFRRGDHATAVERLLGAREIANGFGGSHAQRDVIDWTLTEAAIRGGWLR